MASKCSKVTLNYCMSCESVSRGGEDELQVSWSSNGRNYNQEDKEEAGQHKLLNVKKRLSSVAEPPHADFEQGS